MTGIGMKSAADTTEEALTHFCPDASVAVNAVVFAGVAGGHRRTRSATSPSPHGGPPTTERHGTRTAR
jgi:hypothetical protein